MRILMLSQFYPPTLGGEEGHVHALSTALAERGHAVSVATLWRQGLAECELDGKVRVHRLRGSAQRIPWLFQESDRRHTPPIPDPELVVRLRQVVARERPQIVHAHNWLIHSFLPLKAMSRSKLILTLHDYSLVCAKKRMMYEGAPCDGPGAVKCVRCSADHYGAAKGVPIVLANWTMNLLERYTVDRYIAVSQAVADLNRVPPSETDILPNFVPDDLGDLQGEPPSEVAQLPDGDFMLFAGDLSRDKGIHILLSAYAGLESAPPLVLIGRRCPDTPTSLPPGVQMFHSWPRRAVLWAWRRSMLAVVPSVWPEPWGFVAVEAMIMGRPVIASRIGGLPGLVQDGETGILVPSNDAGALRAAIRRLLDHPDLRAQMGRAAAQWARRFYASAVVPEIERTYAQVLQTSISADDPGRTAQAGSEGVPGADPRRAHEHTQ